MKIEKSDHRNFENIRELCKQIVELEAQVFKEAFHTIESIEERLRNRNYLILTAHEGHHIVGFKVGFEEKPGHFYSWIGGVIPEYRKLGVAKKLMETQHAWLIENSYQSVTTHTENQFKSMLMLNLKFDFDVVGFMQVGSQNKIVLRKDIKQKT